MTALDFYKEGLKAKGFSDEKIKELTEHKDLPWLQFAEDYYTKQLILSGVSQQRELLLAYEDYLNEYHTKEDRIKQVDKYLKANNCG